MAAGDTTKALTAEVRTLFDEASAFLMADMEIYTALSDAQNEYVNNILSQYKAKALVNPSESLPQVLRVLYANPVSGISASSINVPTDFLFDIGLTGTSGLLSVYPLYKKELSRALQFERNNSLLNNDAYYWIDNSKINFSLSLSTYTFNYLSKPPAMTASVDPVIPAFTYAALVQYAYADCLTKDQRAQEAVQAYQKFLQMIKYI